MSDIPDRYTTPPDGTIEFVGASCKRGFHSCKLTPNLRWLTPDGHTNAKLQQASVCMDCGDIMWKDIPIEIENS